MYFLFSQKFLFLLVLFFTIIYCGKIVFSQSNQLTSTVRIAVCGNSIVDDNEICDSTNLAGKTCQDFGFSHGSLSCSIACDEFITSACYTPPTPPGGGGGGGGSLPPSIVNSTVNFSGRAYPGSLVTVLRDGQIVAQSPADPGANFFISVSNLSAGTYNFGLSAQDYQGRNSLISSFTLTVSSGTVVSISNIFISPTIAVSKNNIILGENLLIFGQSVPDSEVTIQVNSEETIFLNTLADEQGAYLYNFNTSPLSLGQHSAKSKSAYSGELSPFGRSVSFRVSEDDKGEEEFICVKADLNCDGKVNLIDFSIAAFWYKRPLSENFKLIEKERLNADGKIDLVDFSILAYYWTG